MHYLLTLVAILMTVNPALSQVGKPIPAERPASRPSHKPTPPPTKPDVPEVSTVVGAFLEAVGGSKALTAMSGIEQRFAWAIGEDSGTLHVQARPGGAFRMGMTMEESPWHVGEGSNGTKTWLEDESGVCYPASDEVGLQLRMERDPTAWAHLDRYIRASTVSSKVDVLGEPHWRLILVPHVGRPWYAFFNVETGLLSRFEFNRPGPEGRPTLIERKLSDWRDVGPIKVAHRVVDESVAGRVDMTLEKARLTTFPDSVFALNDCAKAAFDRPIEVATPADLSELSTDGMYHAKLIEMIGPTLVDAEGRSVSSDILRDKPDVLLYFTAKWCPPCRRFTPKLVDFYKSYAGRRDFMIVLVSSDRSQEKMAEYLQEYKIPFPAVPYARRDSSGIKKDYGGRGIPNLVWLDGQDDVVRGSYEKGTYVGPESVLGAFQKHLGF